MLHFNIKIADSRFLMVFEGQSIEETSLYHGFWCLKRTWKTRLTSSF